VSYGVAKRLSTLIAWDIWVDYRALGWGAWKIPAGDGIVQSHLSKGVKVGGARLAWLAILRVASGGWRRAIDAGTTALPFRWAEIQILHRWPCVATVGHGS